VVFLTDLAAWIGIGGSIALVVTLIVFVLQLRQNTRAIEQNLAISLMGDLTSESFAKRRHHLHETVGKFKETTCEGFDDSPDDFECRSFAYKYELVGLLVERGTLDYDLVKNILQWSVVADWREFSPIDTRLRKRFRSDVSEWRHFKALAVRIKSDPALPRAPSSAS
jgi:hypothetical protein